MTTNLFSSQDLSLPEKVILREISSVLEDSVLWKNEAGDIIKLINKFH